MVRASTEALCGAELLDDRVDRGGAPRQARRRARAQAAQRLRSGAGRGHRSPDLAATVRVPRAARAGAQPVPPRERGRMSETPPGGNPPAPPPPPPGTPGYQPPGFGTPGWQPQPYGASVPGPPPPGYGPPGQVPPGWQPAYAAAAQPPAPVPPLEYHLILRGGRTGWWRNIVGAVSLVAMMYVAVAVRGGDPLRHLVRCQRPGRGRPVRTDGGPRQRRPRSGWPTSTSCSQRRSRSPGC